MVAKGKTAAGPRGRWLPTLAFIRDPRGTSTRWRNKFGDPFRMNALNGPVLVTGRPDLIKQIFSHDPSDYEIFADGALTPILGPGSMLMLSGEQHKRERKLVMPMFHGERMRAYASTMHESTLRNVDFFSNGNTCDFLNISTKISLEVIAKTIFGGEDREAIETLTLLSREVVAKCNPILFFSKKTHFSFGGMSPWDRFQAAQTKLRGAFESEIDRRVTTPTESQDILSMLVSAKYEDGTPMDREHIFDELGTFLFAGHETSAIALAWAVYHLLTNPAKLETLSEEIRDEAVASPEELARLPYLKAVVQETLRLNPIVTEVLRIPRTMPLLGGYRVDRGTAVAASSVLLHYDPDFYPNPDSFIPERFLDRSFAPNEYMPFGGGSRRCAGAAFAMYEMAIVLGTIFRNFELQLREPKPVASVRRNLAMGPSTNVRVEIRKRKT